MPMRRKQRKRAGRAGWPNWKQRGTGGDLDFFGGNPFQRGAARNMLELGKNIREGKTRGQKASHAHGDRLGIEARSARTAARRWAKRARSSGTPSTPTTLSTTLVDSRCCPRFAPLPTGSRNTRSTIARDGPTIRTKAGLKDHPLLRHELAAQSFIVRSLHRLGLDIEPARHEIGRPAGPYRGEA